MATLKEYFETDFAANLRARYEIEVSEAASGQCLGKVVGQVNYDFNSNVRFLSYYIPTGPNSLRLCQLLASNPADLLMMNGGGLVTLPSGPTWYGTGILRFTNNGMENPLGIECHFFGEDIVNGSDLHYSGRSIFYTEDELPEAEKRAIKENLRQDRCSIQFRGLKHMEKRALEEKPLGFISHDSRDKDEVARPLANELSRLMCRVWYDEYSLMVGMSLRESIEQGLRECKKCVLILSPNFLSNTGWTKAEFNAIFTREILERTNFVLPVWHGVTAQDVFQYSPVLADRVGLQWSLGTEEVGRRLYNAITEE